MFVHILTDRPIELKRKLVSCIYVLLSCSNTANFVIIHRLAFVGPSAVTTESHRSLWALNQSPIYRWVLRQVGSIQSTRIASAHCGPPKCCREYAWCGILVTQYRADAWCLEEENGRKLRTIERAWQRRFLKLWNIVLSPGGGAGVLVWMFLWGTIVGWLWFSDLDALPLSRKGKCMIG